jgi:hypothetical protein
VPNLDPAERRRRTRSFEGLPQTWLVANQDDVQTASRDRGKNTVNLDARGPFRAHGIDGDADLGQVVSSSLFSTTMRSL